MIDLKKKATALLFVIFAFVMSMSVVTFAAGAKAEESACPEGTFEIVDKVSIKLNEDGGMRWILKADKTIYDYISENADVELGFIIAPKVFMDNAGGKYYEMEQKLVVSVDKTKIYQVEGDENYYANGCVIKMREENRKYDYTAAAYIKKGDTIEKYAPVNENSVIDFYDVATKAILYTEEDYSKSMLALSVYDWLGGEDFPIEIDTVEKYNSLVGKINEGRDFSGRNIEVKTALDTSSASKLNDGKTFPETMKKVSTVTYYVDGVLYKTEKVREGAAATSTFDKSAEGVEYVFKGWANENGDIVDLSSVMSDISVYASYASYATKGITYAYDVNTDSYYVDNNTTVTDAEINILAVYDDGEHGEKPVTFVKKQAFINNAVIKKVTLPESVIRLDGGVFEGCSALEYVSMTGINAMAFRNLTNTGIYAGSDDETVTNNNFLNCFALRTLIVGKNFNLYADSDGAQQFIGIGDCTPCIDIYVNGEKSESEINATPNSRNNLLTGKVYYKGDLSRCGEWKFDENGNVVTSARNHDYVNGKCAICGEIQTKGITYAYDETNDVYYVAGYTGSDKEVYVLSEYDGKPVTYVKFEAFKDNTNITKVILPESVTDLDGTVFANCSNLKYVSMTGIKALNYGETTRPYGTRYGNNNFMNCVSLETVVVSDEFSSNVPQFILHGETAEKIVRFFVNGASGAPVLQDDALLTGTVYYKGDSSKCFEWNYDENGNIVHGASEHDFADGKCAICGEIQTKGITYAYDETNDVYYVAGYTGSDKEVYVLSEYDGKPVTYVKFEAFKDNANITKVILPESVTDLDGTVFANCSNLKYVSMTGVKALNYGETTRPYGTRYGNNNFMNCVSLETVVVSDEFSSNVPQFILHGETAEKIVRFFVNGASGAPALQDDALLMGTVYYYSETAAENAWHYVNGIATLWA